ncbi:BTB domain-containing protein [Mycena indigotica]|uniref:BTB domain-containing protein n=1 Tax=Mycena indigotica TaxID=2126181 RepID=A0A8H6T5D7_9AGAR|nr:BTB domain-containing protein [Mycena indigotica]KAF7312395.1 BTB domain-containing protein [Mycena indigotica]
MAAIVPESHPLPTTRAPYIQHPVFWLEDGSLVVELDGHGFKVHKTLLTRHSLLFLSHSKSPHYHIGGVEHLQIDPARRVSAPDFVVLLESLYHDVLLSPEIPFPRIVSLVRVSSPNQLHFPRFHEAALRYFVDLFPSGPKPFVHPPYLEEALALAIEFNVESVWMSHVHIQRPLTVNVQVQKGLYYSLVTTSNFDMDEAGENLDSRPPPPSDSSQIASIDRESDPGVDLETAAATPSTGDAHKPGLPLHESQKCTRLMTQFIDYFSPLLFTAPAAAHMACTDVFAGTWMKLVIQPAIEDDGVYKPLETLERFKSVDWAQAGLCGACVLDKHTEWTEEQKAVWTAMDEWLRTE